MASGGKMIQTKNSMMSISRTKVSNPIVFRNTFNAGYLIPIYAREGYPAMNIAINCAELVRSITPLGPTMDNAFLDVFFFKVPTRLVWDHWEEFIAGYNKEAWAQDVEYTVPQIRFKVTSFHDVSELYSKNAFIHSFCDYMPQYCDVVSLSQDLQVQDGEGEEARIAERQALIDDMYSVSALYPRAAVKIWNDWFRNENVQDELELYTGDNDEFADEFAFNLLDPSKLFKANKLHNRISTALPAPVKGPDVLIPMKGLEVGVNTLVAGAQSQSNLRVGDSDVTIKAGDFLQSFVGGEDELAGAKVIANNVSNTIRMLRLATQTELLLQKDAHGGTRYTESILSHFCVHNGDARLQRSEYLGSRSIPLNVQQITNMSQADNNALGNVGGQSVTKDSSFYFSTACTEWCIVLGFAVVRTQLSYSSGVHKQYTRKGRFDFIWPEFKHIGDVQLYTREFCQNHELMVNGGSSVVFGYTPYGSELRSGMYFNSGLFRDQADGSLAYLTYQEQYYNDDYPKLSAKWMEQSTEVVSNTLIDQVGPQFYALWNITEELVIPLDPTSDAGFMDHF